MNTTKGKPNALKGPGIVEKVKAAKSVEEITTLRQQLTTYKYAHKSTINRFNRSAIKRKKQLEKKKK